MGEERWLAAAVVTAVAVITAVLRYRVLLFLLLLSPINNIRLIITTPLPLPVCRLLL